MGMCGSGAVDGHGLHGVVLSTGMLRQALFHAACGGTSGCSNKHNVRWNIRLLYLLCNTNTRCACLCCGGR